MSADNDSSISSLYRSCIQSFRRLLDAFETSGNVPPTFSDQIGRFRAWALSAGAHRFRESQMSLEHRLCEASKVRAVVVDLLVDLIRALRDALSTTSGEDLQLYEQPSDEDESEGSSIGSDPDVEPVPKDPLNERIRDISNIITSLYRFSIATQNPAPTDRLQKCSSIDVSAYEFFDIQHVSEKLPSLNKHSYLVKRLGRANTRRRQLLEYHRRHHEKIAGHHGEAEAAPAEYYTSENVSDHGQSLETPVVNVADSAAESNLYARTVLTETTVSIFHPKEIEHAHVDQDNLDTRSEGELSRTSFSSSISGSDGPRVPNPPNEIQAFSGVPFVCPYCFSIITVTNREAWKRHVYKDLRPYVCTFADCQRSDHLFTTRHEWFEHERQFHRREWFCNACQQSFPHATIFRRHLETSHMESAGQLDTLIERAERTITSAQSCHLCVETDIPTRVIENHIGRHMRKLALFVLPDTDEPESETESKSESTSKSESEVESEPEPEPELGIDCVPKPQRDSVELESQSLHNDLTTPGTRSSSRSSTIATIPRRSMTPTPPFKAGTHAANPPETAEPEKFEHSRRSGLGSSAQLIDNATTATTSKLSTPRTWAKERINEFKNRSSKNSEQTMRDTNLTMLKTHTYDNNQSYGIEATGIVLTLFPAIIEGLKFFYESRDFRDYRAQIKRLVRSVQMEQCIFKNTCEVLLDGLASTEQTISQMSGVGWDGLALQERLGPTGFDAWVEAVNALASHLHEFVNRLELEEQKRQKKTWRRVRLDLLEKESLKKICNTNSRLERLAKSLVIPTKRQQSARQYIKRRDISQNLFSILHMIICGPSSISRVSANLILQRVFPKRSMGDNKFDLRFRVLFDFDNNIALGLEDWCSLEFEPIGNAPAEKLDVHTSNRGDPASPPTSSRLPEGQTQGIFKEQVEKGVGQLFSPRSASSKTQAHKSVSFGFPAPTADNQTPTDKSVPRIHDLDSLIKNPSIVGSNSCIGILGEDKQAFRIFSSSTPSRSYQPEVVSLQTLLQNSSLELRDRLELGVILADTVLSLYYTGWLSENWGTKDIFFPQKQVKHRAGDGSFIFINEPCINLPCVRRQFGSAMPPDHISQEATISIVDKTLFCLGIVLIELWFHKPIGDLGLPQDKDESWSEHIWMYKIAQQCIGELFSSAGETYALSVSRCLGMSNMGKSTSKHIGARNLQNENYITEAYTNIVALLERNLRAFSDPYS